MKKTVNISLGNRSYTIEEDAYEQLDQYVNRCRKSLKDDTDLDDVISDIETAFADRLDERTESSKIVNLKLVKSIILVMGEMEIDDSIESNDKKLDDKKDGWQENVHSLLKHPVYKNRQEKIIDGVCAGLARAVDINPIWVRLAFVGLLFVGGSSILIYIVLMFLLPNEPKDEYKKSTFVANRTRVQKKIDSWKLKSGPVGTRLTSIVLSFIKIILMLLIIGLSIAIVSIISGVGAFLSYIGGQYSTNLAPIGLSNNANSKMLVVSLAIFTIIPIFGVLIYIVKGLGGKSRINYRPDWILALLWIVAIFFVSLSGSSIYRSTDSYRRVNCPESVSVDEYMNNLEWIDDKGFVCKNKKLIGN
jgi:phage shock protein PspC (stress-responsive transcriptional regulator)